MNSGKKGQEERFVAYYRVSTDRQGRSGLGLEAQREAVQSYLGQRGGRLLDCFTEIESGKQNQRPELHGALAACRRQKAILIIAKLDRLARSVHFISGLMESAVEFVAVDNPHANKLMLHLLAAFAEHEREMISERTKAALAAARARGVQLGANGRRLAERHKEAADQFAQEVADEVFALRGQGLSYAAMASVLNEKGIPTANGGRWHAQTVRRILRRVRKLKGGIANDQCRSGSILAQGVNSCGLPGGKQP